MADRAPTEPRCPDVSVVVITYNEEARIGDCLASVAETLAGRDYDAVVVDSASPDRTVEIASRHPVRVARIREGGPRRASIGRHVGTMLTRGRFILFVDGDSVLEPGWIGPALAAMDADPTLAAVSGASLGVLVAPDGTTTTADQYPGVEYDDPPHLSGSALYRRDALERVGGFNPSMCSHEEPELGARLTAAGMRMRRLRIPMTRHYPKGSRETFGELVRRSRSGYLPGLGQYARLALERGDGVRAALVPIARVLQFVVLVALGVVAGVGSVVVRSPWPVLAWLAVMGAVFALFAVRARSLRRPAYYFAEWALTSGPVLRGLLGRPMPPSEFHAFPVQFDLVSEPGPPPAKRESSGS